METINFRLNNSWFNKKKLIPMYSKEKVSRDDNSDNSEDKMSDRSYTKIIRNACIKLNFKQINIFISEEKLCQHCWKWKKFIKTISMLLEIDVKMFFTNITQVIFPLVRCVL